VKNSSGLLPSTGEGIVIDIGTGDGRFVSAAARANPKQAFHRHRREHKTSRKTVDEGDQEAGEGWFA
jgi:hypothetical protein